MFNVTFEIVTAESAEEGDAESRGFIAEGVSLGNYIVHSLTEPGYISTCQVGNGRANKEIGR
jgi:hypothetical protein